MNALRARLDQIADSVTGGDRIDGARLYRESMARARRRRATLVGVATAIAVATIVVVSLFNTGANPSITPAPPPPSVEPSDPSQAEGACPIGEQRAVFLNSRATSVLLGCARLDGRKVELFGGGSLQILGIDNRVRECGYAPSQYEPPMTDSVAAWAIAQRTDSAPLEVYGPTSAEVATVSLRYMHDGSPHRARAELIRVMDGEALERAGIGEPFGYFVGELPAKASDVTALAKDGEGRTLGRAGFEPLLRSQPRRALISGPSR